MKLVKSKPRYRCDYCKKVAGEVQITNHEKICYKNPDRFCELCQNRKRLYEVEEDRVGIPCPYCEKENKY